MKPMKKMDTYIYKLGLWASAALSLAACVDEDLSGCPLDVETREITVSYQIDLHEGVDPGFDNELHSLHLGFWNSPQSLYRDLVFQPADMPEELVFKVTLPVDNYDHLAVANHNNDRVGGGLHAFGQTLAEVAVDETPIAPDTIKALAYAPFAGRLSMRLEDEGTEHYTVLMSPVAGKVVLHVNHPATMKNIKCYLSRTQHGFKCWEGTFFGNDRLRTDATDFKVTEDERLTEFEFYSYPSRAGEVYRRAEAAGRWKLYFYSECGNKIIQHIFTVEDPIESGRVLEATFNITEQGGEAVDVTAGVEIDTDWSPGNGYDQEM